MRILHISTRLILGGSQENTVLSCEGQARLGHDVHLAFGPIHGPEGSLLDRVKAFGAIATHVVPHMVRQINPLADRRCYNELKRLIADLNPDIVHTHS
ncbi:MAG: glycosyltransferase, partial [Dehalococcoidia bacterium]